MLDTSQFNVKYQTPTDSSCRQHPQLDIDTICFDQTCRKNGKQIICSCCGQQQPHNSHIHQQFPIYKTSPGFRLINFQGQTSYLSQMNQQRQFFQEEIAQLKKLAIELIDDMAKKHSRKIQCYKDFLKKNAIFNICSKIRHHFEEHLDCCIPMVNNLKDAQDKKIHNSANQLIKDKIREQSQMLLRKIEYVNNGLKNLFSNSSQTLEQTNPNKVIIGLQGTDSRPQQQLQLANNKSGTRKITTFSKSSQNRKTANSRGQLQFSQKNNNILIQSSSKSLINELMIFEKQQNEPRFLQNTTINKVPVGLTVLEDSTIHIWDSNNEAIKHLFDLSNTKHLIIQDSSFANQRNFQKIFIHMPMLKGVHFNCQVHIRDQMLKLLELLKPKLISIMPSYRFIQLIDRCKYFPKVQRTMLDHIPPKLCQTLFKNNKLKNTYIMNRQYQINQSIEEVNFIQDQKDIFWNFKMGMQAPLLIAKKIQILVFSNILIDRNVSLRKIYQKYGQLHTIVFDDCIANHDKLVYQFKHLKNQLMHVQISGDSLDQRINLSSESIEQIFRQTHLRTLILTNIQVVDKSKRQDSRQFFKGINNLANLLHLNLYNTWPVFPNFIYRLHRKCKRNLRLLNIGCSQITMRMGWKSFYQCFPKIQSLSLDYTQVAKHDLFRLLKGKQNLQYLSIQNLNGKPIQYEQQNDNQSSPAKRYGYIPSTFFNQLPNKTLRYVNIYNCSGFKDYEWEGYNQLQCIRANEGLISETTIQKLQKRGIKINLQKNYQVQGGSADKIINVSSSEENILDKHINVDVQDNFDKKGMDQRAQDHGNNCFQGEIEASDSSLMINQQRMMNNTSRKIHHHSKHQSKYINNLSKGGRNCPIEMEEED